MIIRITDKCSMGCSHCMIDSLPSSGSMDFGTFMKSVNFAVRNGVRVIIISGGEPTDHQAYNDMMNYLLLNFQGSVSVCTHGEWVKDPELVAKYMTPYPKVNFQIVNDPLYYPRSLDKEGLARTLATHPNAKFFDYISAPIYPQGRARTRLKVSEKTTTSKGTRCFNLRSIANHPQFNTIGAAIRQLESMGKFCQPSVNINGSISMGESNECPTEVSVVDTDETIYQSVKCSQCNDCNMLDTVSPAHKAAIGYYGG
ncbi:MAG: radical SAM protein [Aestuariibacter sp.]|nr:radical SAM protein [Aestuariibacter sp.]